MLFFKKYFYLLAFICFTTHLSAQLPSNTIITADDFENGVSGWNIIPSGATNISWVADDTGRNVRIQATNASNTLFLTRPIDVSGLKGSKLSLIADIKAENLTRINPAQTWNGIKVMLIITKADGSKLYPQLASGVGTFDWTKKGMFIDIPTDATAAILQIGIENSTGTAWFDNIQLKVKRSVLDYPMARTNAIDKLHLEPMLRGMMVTNTLNQTDLTDIPKLKSWNVNVVRWQIGNYVVPSEQVLNYPNIDVLVAAQITKLDASLPALRQANIKVVLDLHSLSQGCLHSAQGQLKIVEIWKQLAQKYKHEHIIWGYDIANEPFEGETWRDEIMLWEDLAEKIAKEIRLIDSEKTIIIECLWGAPSKFIGFKPIDFQIKNVIYSTHFYEPLYYTHQGTPGNTTDTPIYPSTINGVVWNKAQLKTALQPVKDFQDKYKVPIFIGEFSTARWAAGADTYLRDAIEIFEEYNWDWVYHAFREYPGWDLELSEDKNNPNRTATPSARAMVVLPNLANNIANCPTLSISGVNITCAEGIYTYTTTIIAGAVYKWTVVGGTILSGQGTNKILVKWGNGTSSVSLDILK